MHPDKGRGFHWAARRVLPGGYDCYLNTVKMPDLTLAHGSSLVLVLGGD